MQRSNHRVLTMLLCKFFTFQCKAASSGSFFRWIKVSLMKYCFACVMLTESEQWDCVSVKSREQLQRSLSTLQSDSRPDLRDKAQELRRHIQSQPWAHRHTHAAHLVSQIYTVTNTVQQYRATSYYLFISKTSHTTLSDLFIFSLT